MCSFSIKVFPLGLTLFSWLLFHRLMQIWFIVNQAEKTALHFYFFRPECQQHIFGWFQECWCALLSPFQAWKRKLGAVLWTRMFTVLFRAVSGLVRDYLKINISVNLPNYGRRKLRNFGDYPVDHRKLLFCLIPGIFLTVSSALAFILHPVPL